ncbi:retrovirus-related pol polyprotein from transposon TNT 1-94, partial [Trifolium medium]|nr:retrovirus-related pol polyprotein from transposon TNT 1-94 [Trifolium medium]
MCIFLGYKLGMKGVVLLDINTREILVSRNITHHETIFPYRTPNHPSSTWSYYPSSNPIIDSNIPADTTPPSPSHSPSPDIPSAPLSPSTIPPSSIEPSHNSRPHREKHAPSYLKDYVCNSSTSSQVPFSS